MSYNRLPAPIVVWAALLSGCFYVTEDERKERWDLDDDGVERPADCDDGDAEVQQTTTWYVDADGDGVGDGATAEDHCQPPEDGMVTIDGDCDDSDPTVFPDARETCDGIDNDCDGTADEDLADFTWYRDGDGDGAGVNDDTIDDCARPDGYVAEPGDCDDTDPSRYPGADELCDSIDQDCDGRDDLSDPDLTGPVDSYPDDDMDGWGDSLALPDQQCPPQDGWVLDDSDCDDDDPDRNPDADEVCDGIDNDCDEEVDEDAIDGVPQWPDVDGDGRGDATIPTPTIVCLGTPGWATNDDDCDDGDPDAYPGAPEICGDGVNNDCDTETDEVDCIPGDTGDTG